jgi:hypothetical protein
MSLGEFKSNSGGAFPAGTPFDATANEGHPLVVIVHGFKEDFSTAAYPNPRPVAFVMVADLQPLLEGGQPVLYGNAILGGDAVADRLRPYAGQVGEDGEPVKLPIKLGKAKSNSTGRTYRTVEALTGAELALAVKWDTKNPTALQDDRARLVAEAEARSQEEESAPAKATSAPKAASKAQTISDEALEKAMAALG